MPAKEDVQYPITDVQLSQRLESTEAAANIAFVESRMRLDPRVGATYARIGDVDAMYDGPESPLTQTFGLGASRIPSSAEFGMLEDFFSRRGAPVHHEVTPIAPPELIGRLVDRGYVPIEQSTVLVRPTTPLVVGNSRATARPIQPGEELLWTQTAAEGWSSESAELAAFVEAFGRILTGAANVHCFLAEIDGQAAAAGVLSISGHTALLAGASTIPSARRQGAQLALLAARLELSLARGVGLAMMVAQPGSASQRNAERQGFRTAYTRTKWRLRTSGA